MGKSKSYPCRHPRTAVSAALTEDREVVEYLCKKCSTVCWAEKAEPVADVQEQR